MGVKRFDFDVPLVKAYKSNDGKMHVVGVASDTLDDTDDDYVSKKGLKSMARQCTDGKLDLLETHRSTFGFGKTDDAVVRPLDDTGNEMELAVDFELDDRWPQAVTLFGEVLRGDCRKQLSIGGKLVAGSWEYEDKPDGGRRRRVDDVTLDHIAVTRPGKAANERTRWVQAIVKSLDSDDVDEEDKNMAEEQAEDVGKKATPYKKLPTVTEASWRWDAARSNAVLGGDNWGRFKQAHAYWRPDYPGHVGENPPTIKAAYKLPHCVMSGGTLKVHWPGTGFAMAALLGARGGVAMPREDKRTVYNRLARYYRDFDRTPPGFRLAGPFGKEKEEPWLRDEFIEFHEKQDIDMSWLTEEKWQKAIDGFSAEETEMTEEKNMLTEDEELGKSFLGKIGSALRGLVSKKKLLTPEVEEIAEWAQAVEAEVEKGQTNLSVLRRSVGLLDSFVRRVADEIGVPIERLGISREAVSPSLAGFAESINNVFGPLRAKEFSKTDLKALVGIARQMRQLSDRYAVREKNSEEEGGKKVEEEKKEEEEIEADETKSPEEKSEEVKEEGPEEKPETEAAKEEAEKKVEVPPAEKKGDAENKKEEASEEKEEPAEEAKKPEEEKTDEEGEKSSALTLDLLKSTLEEVFTPVANKLTELEGRLGKIEKVAGVSQGIAGQDDIEKQVRDKKKQGGIWKGVLGGALKDATAKMDGVTVEK